MRTPMYSNKFTYWAQYGGDCNITFFTLRPKQTPDGMTYTPDLDNKEPRERTDKTQPPIPECIDEQTILMPYPLLVSLYQKLGDTIDGIEKAVAEGLKGAAETNTPSNPQPK